MRSQITFWAVGSSLPEDVDPSYLVRGFLLFARDDEPELAAKICNHIGHTLGC